MSARELCDVLLGVGIVGCAIAIIKLRIAITALSRQIKNKAHVKE